MFFGIMQKYTRFCNSCKKIDSQKQEKLNLENLEISEFGFIGTNHM